MSAEAATIPMSALVTSSAAMVGPTCVWLLLVLSIPRPNCRATPSSNWADCTGVSGDVRIRKVPLVAGCTTPLTFWWLTAACTCWRPGCPSNFTVNSLPPWKSMPRRKPRVTIEMIPGTMISSETRKKMFRWLMMSSRRTGAAACAAFSAAASLGRLSSATGHPQHVLRARPPEVEHDGQQVVRDDDRRDQADPDADRQRDREALHGPRADQDQDAAGDQRRDVGVADRRPGPPDGGV